MPFFRPNILQMHGYVPGEQPQEGKYIKLNTNENPYPPSIAVEQAIRSRLDQGLMRYPDAMATAFRVRAAELHGVGPDWILCGNGSDDLLTIITRALVGPADRLRLPYPSYILYKNLAELQDAAVEEIFFLPEWQLSPQFFVSSDQLKVVLLPNPNSPSGTLVPRTDIARLASSLTCPLVVDEAYADFASEHCVDLVREHENIIVTRSLSKGYGLAGLRFGYLIAQPHIVEQLVKVKDSYNCDALSIAGATAAIDDQRWLQQNRQKVIATRGRLEVGMRDLGFSVQPSQANFVWCTHADRPLKPIYDALKQHRILVRYMNYPGWGDGLRISVGTDEQIDACLQVISSLK